MTIFEILPSLRRAASPFLDQAVWPLTTSDDELGRLCVGGVAMTEVADRFGTPTYVIDEADFRHRIRYYRTAVPEVSVVYAGRALLTTAVAQWVAEEGACLGVGSGGELATALIAGVDPSQIVVHGKATTSRDLYMAARAAIGRIVVETPSEVTSLATCIRRPQSVQVEATPGVALTDVHSAALERILDQPLLYLTGLHCNIGSQVTDPSLYGDAIRQMVPRMAELRARRGVILTELNIGGGHGVPYVSGDPELDLLPLRDFINDALDASCAAERFPRPTVVVQPGRAISARAGVTLYRVMVVQSQPGGATMVFVDGSVSDKPQSAVPGARYSVALANRRPLTPPLRMTIFRQHFGTDDEIVRDVSLPEDLRAGDLLAVACTGAYHHSTASTYNMLGRPPLVAVKDGRIRELVRRETVADLLARDRCR
jgi:diaminopimelate decarboxylase